MVLFTPPPLLPQFAHGQSNPTFWVRHDNNELVIRKKPPGKLVGSAQFCFAVPPTLPPLPHPPPSPLPSPPPKQIKGAHSVEREHEVISKLAAQGIPVATPRFLCEDERVIGTPFYAMDYIRGRVFTQPAMPDSTPADRTAAYHAMGAVLAQIHNVDVDKAGLGDYGRPSGYVQR